MVALALSLNPSTHSTHSPGRARLSSRRVLVGGAFTTVEQFEEVAKAISECAFIASLSPVVLSMEVAPADSNAGLYLSAD